MAKPYFCTNFFRFNAMKKRLLFIPLNYDIYPRPHEDWFNAFNKYFKCVYFGENFWANSEFTFDYIFVQSGAIDMQWLLALKEKYKSKIIQWTGDARAGLMDNVTQYKGIVDLTLLAVGIAQKKMYENALGSPVDYLQQGVFESFFLPPKELQSGKIVFIGNKYDQFEGSRERSELCEMLSKEFPNDFEVIGNGFNNPKYNNSRSIPYLDSAKIYNKSYISISHACFNDIEGYYSNRTLDIMASGGCCLMRYSKDAEKYLAGLDVVAFYDSNKDCLKQINRLIENSQLRNNVSVNGSLLAKRNHTFEHRIIEIKELIEKHL